MRWKLFSILLLLHSFIANSQIISTIAGGGLSLGDEGPAILAKVTLPYGGCFDAIGNYYFLQSLSNPRLRMIDTSGIIHTVAGNGIQGFSGDSGVATSAQLFPQGFIVDSTGNIYIADRYNYRVRKVDASTHIITTIAGNGTQGFSGDGGPAIAAEIIPLGICVDKIGNTYIIDASARIRKIDTFGIIHTIAGNGIAGYSGDGGLAISASIAPGYGICLDKIGNIYIDCATRIRKVNLASGIITTIAGTGVATYIGDGMHADSAQFNAFTIGIDDIGNIFIADYVNDRVYKIDTANIFHLVAGTGVGGYNGDGGLADTSQLYNPEGVAVDNCGNLYIADEANNRIRKVTFNPNCFPEHVKEANKLKDINIYPNPAQQQLTISSNNAVKQISILNTIGQVLIDQVNYTDKAVVDVSNLSPGLYFIKVIDKNGTNAVQRFVKE